MTSACALDLGSTVYKTAVLDGGGRLVDPVALPAPEVRGAGPIRESDPEASVDVASALLDGLRARLPGGTPLGLACQRSSFLLWERDSGAAATPLVSWQDTRAADWCARHRSLAPLVVGRAGLVLSAHYAGPKLASMFERDPELHRRCERGDLVFGTLDAWLLRRLGRHGSSTDPTMAARTALVDLERLAWSPELCGAFGVPAAALPTIRPTTAASVELSCGLTLGASLADQAAGALAMLAPGSGDLLVNLGTGTFVLREIEDGRLRRAGYLTAPILAGPRAERRFVLEGSINGGGALADRCASGPTPLPPSDRAPEAFCLPDTAGLGAPHWRPEIGVVWSAAARSLDGAGRRRVALEGLLFRVLEIVDGMGARSARRVILSGGLSREPFVALGLAALLGREVERLHGAEAGLEAAARLAAGLDPRAASSFERVAPPAETGSWLAGKYERFRVWLAGRLAAERPGEKR